MSFLSTYKSKISNDLYMTCHLQRTPLAILSILVLFLLSLSKKKCKGRG